MNASHDWAAEERLPCGASTASLLDQVSASGATTYDLHQTRCPHCQAALAEYDRLWAPVKDLAAEPVHPPDSLLESALARIRGVATDPGYGTITGPRGSTRIAARVVVVTARQTAQAIAGVRVALSAILPPAEPAGTDPTTLRPRATLVDTRLGESRPDVVAGVSGRSTAIEITLAADYGLDLQTLAEDIRRAVTTRVREITGLEPVVVSVRIDDVFT